MFNKLKEKFKKREKTEVSQAGEPSQPEESQKSGKLSFFKKIDWQKANPVILIKKLRLMRARQLIFWILAVILLVYFAGAIVGVVGIYTGRFKTDRKITRVFAWAYPYPAAVVSTDTIFLKDIVEQEKYITFFANYSKQPMPELKELNRRLIDAFVETKLAQKEIGQHKIVVRDYDIDGALQKIYDENGGKEQVEKMLKELYGMDAGYFRKMIADQLYKDKLQKEVLLNVKLQHILKKDEGQANELKDKARAGEDFGELAKNNSEDLKSKDAGGELGWVWRDSGLFPEFADAAFKLKVGEISDPVKTDLGFHVIKVEERKGYIDKGYSDWLNEAKNKTKIWTLFKH